MECGAFILERTGFNSSNFKSRNTSDNTVLQEQFMCKVWKKKILPDYSFFQLWIKHL